MGAGVNYVSDGLARDVYCTTAWYIEDLCSFFLLLDVFALVMIDDNIFCFCGSSILLANLILVLLW